MASYKTIATLSSGKYTEKGSRFIAYALHVLTEKEALDFIDGNFIFARRAKRALYNELN